MCGPRHAVSQGGLDRTLLPGHDTPPDDGARKSVAEAGGGPFGVPRSRAEGWHVRRGQGQRDDSAPDDGRARLRKRNQRGHPHEGVLVHHHIRRSPLQLRGQAPPLVAHRIDEQVGHVEGDLGEALGLCTPGKRHIQIGVVEVGRSMKRQELSPCGPHPFAEPAPGDHPHRVPGAVQVRCDREHRTDMPGDGRRTDNDIRHRESLTEVHGPSHPHSALTPTRRRQESQLRRTGRTEEPPKRLLDAGVRSVL
jgi:hypothetical protein